MAQILDYAAAAKAKQARCSQDPVFPAFALKSSKRTSQKLLKAMAKTAAVRQRAKAAL